MLFYDTIQHKGNCVTLWRRKKNCLSIDLSFFCQTYSLEVRFQENCLLIKLFICFSKYLRYLYFFFFSSGNNKIIFIITNIVLYYIVQRFIFLRRKLFPLKRRKRLKKINKTAFYILRNFLITYTKDFNIKS